VLAKPRPIASIIVCIFVLFAFCSPIHQALLAQAPTQTSQPVAPEEGEATATPADAVGETTTPTKLASTATAVPARLAIVSPAPQTMLGGVISIIGSASLTGLRSYSLAFGAGLDPSHWIQIAEVHGRVVYNERLAFWDTTIIPDGIYTLRLRAIYGVSGYDFRDIFVGPLLVSNAPRSPTPAPSFSPTPTSTLTPIPSPTPTAQPTIALEDGISPFLFVTQMAQYDPFCIGWGQRYSIWVSNVGMVTLTNILLTDTLPYGSQPILEQSSPGARLYDGANVLWSIDALGPGQARQFELQLEVFSWVEAGQWLTNKVTLSADQLPYVAKSHQALISKCVELKATAAARPFVMPTLDPTATPAPTRTPAALSKPTLQPTPLSVSVPEQTVKQSLDVLTVLISISLGVLLIVAIVLIYRNLSRKR
jgi:hypothetical protein